MHCGARFQRTWQWPARPWHNLAIKTHLDRVTIQENTLRVNIIKPIVDRILPLLEQTFPTRFRRRITRPRTPETQLEFTWHSKR